jgi:Cdc6-like AAA superfamily ATPase
VSEEQPTGQIAIGSYIAQALGQGARATINIFRGGTAEQRALHNRQAMLKLVHDYWVKGVLEQSLHGVAMIEFRLERKAGAVKNPWNMVLQTEREDRVLPPGTRIIDVFDEMRENLLILGAPGSGKTTMLLELARSTIARAEEDPLQPIPVVLNLSSWAEKRQPLAEWLVEELNTKLDSGENE